MNATDHTETYEMLSKISRIVSLFKEQFLDAHPDLSPWIHDPALRYLIDPHSIDLCFHFPGWHPTCHSHCILTQIRFSESPKSADARIIGIESMGYTHTEPYWRCCSTTNDWDFDGKSPPTLLARKKLEQFFQDVYALFGQSDNAHESP